MDKKVLLSTTDNKQIMEVFQALNQTSDDYFFILDIKEDSCFFCDRVRERFHISSDFICPAGEGLRELVAEEDFPLLIEDLRQLRAGEKNTMTWNTAGTVKIRKSYGSTAGER